MKSIQEMKSKGMFKARYGWELLDNNGKIHFSKFKRNHPATLKLNGTFRFGIFI